MPTFKISATILTDVEYTVEADTEDAALELAATGEVSPSNEFWPEIILGDIEEVK